MSARSGRKKNRDMKGESLKGGIRSLSVDWRQPSCLKGMIGDLRAIVNPIQEE